MLPEKLSTDLTSLNEQQDRLAIVVEFVVSPDGSLKAVRRLRRHASATRRSSPTTPSARGSTDRRSAAAGGRGGVRAWTSSCEMQDRVAQALRRERHEHGALEFETVEVQPVFDGDTLQRRAAATAEPREVADRESDGRGQRRHRAVPGRAWLSVAAARRAIAGAVGSDSCAGRGFGRRRCPRARFEGAGGVSDAQRQADAEPFTDLSLTIIRLLGSGEYVVDPPGAEPPGHFGLAVRDYSHSTAPNRRFPDLDHAASAQSGARRRIRRRTRIAELEQLADALHAAGRRRQQGRAAGAQVGDRDAGRVARRRAVRRVRHRGVDQGHVRARVRRRRSRASW